MGNCPINDRTVRNVLKTLLRALDDERLTEVCEGPEKGDYARRTATQKQLQVKDLEIRQLRETNLDLADATKILKDQIQAQADYAYETHRDWQARQKKLEKEIEDWKEIATTWARAYQESLNDPSEVA